tara:strand:+ start:558 stop:1076 length:519 start_codon:yes stop_codon:yes gene_type:complete
MRKKIFTSKNNNNYFIIILTTFISILLIYFISFFININKKYFIITNQENNIFYIIPNDREGEKVKFVNKKSLNNLFELSDIDININISDLKYTIQLYSDSNYKNIEIYINNILNPKNEIMSINEIFIFYIQSEIGTDFFITYKNFDTRIDAMNYCEKISFIKKCLIINPQYQ